MTDKVNMANLTGAGTRVLAPGEPEASQRPVRRRPDGAAQAEVSSRQQQRDARAYAESWWRAIREWETFTGGGLLVIGERSRSGSGRQMVPVVGNWSGTPAAVLEYTKVRTPMGWISETALALACNASEVLSKLRDGGGMGSLIHSSGQGWNGKEALGHGVLVLRVAARLGDQTANHHLDLLKLGKIATIFVELPQE